MSQIKHWNDRYVIGDTPWDTGNPSFELKRVLAENKIRACTAIDLGCGTGTNAIYLAEQGFDVTAIDLSPLAVDRACSKNTKAITRPRFLSGDLFDPPDDLGGPFGFFFDRGCYHILRMIDLARYLETLKQITHPGSVGLVLAGNAREKMEKGPPVVTEEEIRKELGGFSEIVRLREFRFDPIKGPEDQPLGWSCFLRRVT